MKNQALFSSKDISKKLKRRLLQFLIGALRVNSGWLFWFLHSLRQISVCMMEQSPREKDKKING